MKLLRSIIVIFFPRVPGGLGRQPRVPGPVAAVRRHGGVPEPVQRPRGLRAGHQGVPLQVEAKCSCFENRHIKITIFRDKYYLKNI